MDARLFNATEPDWIRAAIAKHGTWIEAVLGVPLDSVVLLKVDNNLTSLPARRIMHDVSLARLAQGPTDALRASVASVEFPAGMPPIVGINDVVPCSRLGSQRAGRDGDKAGRWEISWGDTPVAIRFHGMASPIIAIEVPYEEQGSTSICSLVLCRQDVVAEVLKLVRESNARTDGALFSTGRGFKSVRTASWNDLVLDDSVRHLIRNDFESFFSREEWFRSHHLPFRRGYLLHGPAGNGKTSCIRAMLSRPGMCGLTMNFFARNRDDNDLERLFERAAENAPSILVLEDIDRAFPRNQLSGAKCTVSLQQLLNCLDGIGTEDGVIVVATANEPTALDPAILSRPGRFDRVVLFPNPTAELRMKYLLKMSGNLEEGKLREAVRQSDGFSFAQMREAYILAGQLAYEQHTDITPTHINRAMQTLRNGFRVARRSAGSVGFSPANNDLEEDERDEFDDVQETLTGYRGARKV